MFIFLQKIFDGSSLVFKINLADPVTEKKTNDKFSNFSRILFVFFGLFHQVVLLEIICGSESTT